MTCCRNSWMALLLPLGLSLCLFNPKPTNAIHAGEHYYTDLAYYYGDAQSLYQGHGYTPSFLPQISMDRKYPPGLPLFFLSVFLLGSSSFFALKMAILFCFALFLILFWYYLKQALSSEETLLLLPIFFTSVFNFNVIDFSHALLSETPYLLCSIVSFYLFHRYVLQPRTKTYVWLILFCLLSVLFRTVGLVLLLGISAGFLFQRRIKKGLILFLIPFLFTLFWVLGAAYKTHQPPAYFTDNLSHLSLGNYVLLFKENVIRTLFWNPLDLIWTEWISSLSLFKVSLFRIGWSTYVTPKWIFSLFWWILIGRGILSSLRRGQYIPETIYLMGYLFVLCIHVTGGGDVRLLVPLVPFLLLFFFLGLSRFPYRRMLVTVGMALLLGPSFYVISPLIPERVQQTLYVIHHGPRQAWESPSLYSASLQPYLSALQRRNPKNRYLCASLPPTSLSSPREFFYIFSQGQSCTLVDIHKDQELWSSPHKSLSLPLQLFLFGPYLSASYAGLRKKLSRFWKEEYASSHGAVLQRNP